MPVTSRPAILGDFSMKSTAWAALLLIGVALLSASCGGGGLPQLPTPVGTPTPQANPGFPAILAAGDVSCDTATPQLSCQSRATSEILIRERERRAGTGVAVLPLGDLQYDIGTFAEFNANYDKTWGRLNEVAHPTPGNHEYDTRNASGYFDYFLTKGVSVGARNEGWYDFEFAGWKFISLNSNCSRIGGCHQGSSQYRWLQGVLLQNRAACTVAYMHHPFVSTGLNGNTPELFPIMQLLYENRVEIVLSGHDHNYERFVQMTPQAVEDTARGFRLFVVGTGGRDLQGFTRTHARTAFRKNDEFGVLKIELKEGQYQWAFVTIDGRHLDPGQGVCF